MEQYTIFRIDKRGKFRIWILKFFKAWQTQKIWYRIYLWAGESNGNQKGNKEQHAFGKDFTHSIF